MVVVTFFLKGSLIEAGLNSVTFRTDPKRPKVRSRKRASDQVMSDERSPVVDERSRTGEWEMGTIVSSTGVPLIVTMVVSRIRY
jgi:IS30 family transposase